MTSLSGRCRFLVLVLMTSAEFLLVVAGETSGDADTQNLATKITSFTSNSALTPVGGTIELRCSVVQMASGVFIQLRKQITGTDVDTCLTTNHIKEAAIASRDRFKINAVENDDGGFDFTLTIENAIIEDTGIYVCTVPAMKLNQLIDVTVVAPPDSVVLFVDDRPVEGSDSGGQLMEYSNVTSVSLKCVATGGNPAPTLQLVRGTDNEEIIEPTSGVANCDLEDSAVEFLPSLKCASTVTVNPYIIDYIASGKTVRCSARSRGSADSRFTKEFIPHLTGAPPQMTCKTPVMAGVYQRNVKIFCDVLSTGPLREAYITWPDAERSLQPSQRWPDGVLFDRDDEYMAYLRPSSEGSKRLELEFDRVSEIMFHEYTYVTRNDFGRSEKTVILDKDPSTGFVRSGSRLTGTGSITIVVVMATATVVSTLRSRWQR